jgi:DNA-binding NarL/FixJ family response regulator
LIVKVVVAFAEGNFVFAFKAIQKTLFTMIPITILIVDDHKLVREAWTMILNSDERLRVVGGCPNAESAVMEVKELRPNVVIMDINMPGMNGIDAVPLIRKFAPAAKILGVSLYTFPDVARKMMQAGASGYVTKNSSREELVHAITEIVNGKKYLCREVRNLVKDRKEGAEDPKTLLSSLSMRQIEIISAIRTGHTSKEIAVQLKLSPKTVEIHRYKILKKLKLSNAAELVDFFNRHQTEF